MADFTAEVFQNEYLAANADVVDAVVTVTAAGGDAPGPGAGIGMGVGIEAACPRRGARGARCDQHVRAAIAGDMQAAREIGDRMDGKPKQAIETSGELDLRVTQGQEAAAELESIIKAIASKDAETRSESVH